MREVSDFRGLKSFVSLLDIAILTYGVFKMGGTGVRSI